MVSRAALVLALGLSACGGGGSGANGSGGSGGGSSGGSTSGGTSGGGGAGATAGAGGASGAGASSGSGGSACADGDSDKHGAVACGGDDCDDADAAVHPGAPEPVTSVGTIDMDSNGGNADLIQAALGPSDSLHLLYSGKTGLMLTTWNGTSWKNQTVGPLHMGASLAVDSKGAAHVVYRSGSFGAYSLSYTTDASGSWVTTTLSDAANADPSVTNVTEVVVDGSDVAHVAYTSDADYHVAISGGAAAKSPLASKPRLLAVDTKGVLQLLSLSGGVKISSYVGGAWVDGPSTTQISTAKAFATDAQGRVHIASGDSSNVEYYVSGPSGLAENHTTLKLHKSPLLVRSPSGTVHLFATKILSTFHVVGSDNAYFGPSGFLVQTMHTTQSYVQELLGLLVIDSQGRLHRLQPLGIHTFWDAADTDCDGLAW
ncbi:MAG: hypothetical protein U0263_20110 [Polyangiaceae bacterium]